TQASRLVLPPGKQRLQFNYTGLSFVKSHRIRFKHKLEGYDHDWVDAGVARSTIYTSLSPGEYIFRVIAGNSGGVWNDKGASFSFYLKPWFYQTTWFYFLVVLFGLLSAVSFYRFRVRQLKARERELGALVEERTQDLKERNIELETAREKIQRSKDMIEGKNAQLESQTLQLQQQSEKLKELDRVKSRFFANISHEFRTPLTLIMGPLEQVLSDYPDDEKLEKKVDLSLRNSRRLLALINQLLDLSKLDSGKMRLQALKQNILPYLKGLVGSFESLTQQKRLNLSFHSKEEEIILYFDAEKLDRAIINLIANAVKFTPGGGEVIVNAVSRDEPVEHFPSGYLEITVSDTGTGIPPDQLPYIFDRFYQARGSGGGRSGQSKHKGTGIGLALVHEVVGLHHGDVRVESEEGSGARFIVRLPLGSGHLEPEEITGEGNMPGMPIRNGGIPLPDAFEIGLEQEEDENERNRQETHGKEEENGNDTGKNVILVVEDNPDVRRYIREPLESDYIVKEAANGRSGIEKAKMFIPDLIISDVMMPEADGYELCDTLKKDIGTSHIPIILLTAKASDESVIEGLETGADDYITKPFNPKILLTRIRNLIDLRRGLQERVQREMVLQPTDIEVSSIDQEFMKSLKQVMEANLQDPDFGIDKLTKELYMSRATLNRKIKALTGESTNQFIQSYRIKRAAQLLKANFGNVTEVAFEVGFSSSAYFTKCFKDKFHRLPHAFQAAEGGK
ncbi:MAG: response regulator, partial [bacterium]|nr:response regulator [bacterium]